MPKSQPPPESRVKAEACVPEGSTDRFKALAKRLLQVPPAELRAALDRESGIKRAKPQD